MLTQGKSLKKSSSLTALSPFIDESGILRVGGRLKNAQMAFNAKHQMLLPHSHQMTKLIVMSVHVKSCHGGRKLTEAVLRQKFWLTNRQRTIKSVISSCVKCFRANPHSMEQVMAHLPAVRVNSVEKPFTNTAVDYTGAVLIKIAGGRGYQTRKAYLAIFVCMSVKAVHIEVVTQGHGEKLVQRQWH